ncbi:ubiquinol-cytochrome c reductase core subunit 1 [Globomyces sp. JEL0801]|nr:ubiquinol-cytochrome c reductase core subunit 1 [Globomyces sp. JEL0801]
MLRLNRLRHFATDAVAYNRNGEQITVGPKAIKQLSKVGGISIASYDTAGPASSVAVVLKAGSRFDSLDAPGLAHLTKTSLIRNLPNDSAVRTFLDAELRGNSLYSAVSREHITFGANFLRDDVVDVVPTLLENALNSQFETYEFIEAAHGAVKQTASALSCRHEQVNDKLHQVAFRTGLGNSIYAKKEAVAGLSRSDIKSFTANQFTEGNIAVVATGVSHSDLKTIVESTLSKLKVQAAANASVAPSKYFGGEARIESGPKSTAIYAVAYPGVAFTSPDYYASLVLGALLQGSKSVKRGNGSGCLGAVGTEDTSVKAFTKSYSDAGLVGFVVEGKTAEIKSTVSAAIDALKSVSKSISAEALEGAKKGAIVTLEADLTRAGVIDALGKEALTGSTLLNIEAINSVTAADVQKVNGFFVE